MSLGLARTIYIYDVHTVYWQGNRHIYGHTRCTCTVLANPINVACICLNCWLYDNWLYDRLVWRSKSHAWQHSNTHAVTHPHPHPHTHAHTWLQHSTQFFLALNLESTPFTSLSILAKRSVASGSSFFTCVCACMHVCVCVGKVCSMFIRDGSYVETFNTAKYALDTILRII
jgi:hypothetical protein